MSKRAAIYIRQSQTSDGTISPELQEQHVKEFIAKQGWTPTKVYSDIDISGRKTTNRPGLLALVADYKARKFDIAVADDYSRFSRDMGDGADIIGSMEVATYAEGIPDPEDDFAPLLYMLLAHKYSRDMGKRWKATHAYRLAKGLPPNGVRQYGYNKLPDGSYVINEEEAEVLRWLYERYTRGTGTIQLVQELNAKGVRTVRGNEFQSNKLFDLLDKPFAAGYFVWAGVEYKGAHQPILTEIEWTAYKDARQSRKIHQAPRNPKWWLAGIAKCGRCGANLVSTTIRGNAVVGCSTYNNKGKSACAGVFRNRKTVEAYVGTWLMLNLQTWVNAMPSDDEARNAAQTALEEAEANLKKAKDAMTQLLLAIGSSGLSEDMTAEAMAVRKAEIDEAEKAVKDAQLAIAKLEPAEGILKEVFAGFERMGFKDGRMPDEALPEFRRSIAQIIERVEVHPKDSKESEVKVIPKG